MVEIVRARGWAWKVAKSAHSSIQAGDEYEGFDIQTVVSLILDASDWGYHVDLEPRDVIERTGQV